MRKRSLLLALGPAALLAACGSEPAPPAAPPPPPVTVAVPLQQRIVDWDDYVGRFEAVKSVAIRARVSGYLTGIHFRDGDFVHKGQLLFTIDPRPYEATLAQARAQAGRQRATLALARSELARSARLVAAEAIAKEEYETRRAAVQTAQADVAAADADVRAAELNVGFTQVRSPIDGRVSDRRVDIGNLVGGSSGGTAAPMSNGATGSTTPASAGSGTASDGSVLTTVVTIDPVYFGFDASEALYLKYERQNQAGTRVSSRVRANPVEIRLQDEPTYRIHGTMNFVDNAIDVGAGTIRGRALVPNHDHFLTPGMFGRMRLLGSGAYTALLVPDGVVQTDQTRKTVLVVGPDNKAHPRVVETGPLINGLRVIRKGLSPNDHVIINGLQLAQADKPVSPQAGKIVPPEPGTSPTQAAYSPPEASEATAVSH